MSDATIRDPERPDDDNPELTREELQGARPAAEVLPELIGENATAELFERSKRIRENREWDELRAYGQARMEALGLGSMTDDEVEAYVDRAIHEYRQEQREKERAGKGADIPPQ